MRLDNKKTFSYGKKSEESSDVLFLKWVTEYSLEKFTSDDDNDDESGRSSNDTFCFALMTSILFIQKCEATGTKYSGILWGAKQPNKWTRPVKWVDDYFHYA